MRTALLGCPIDILTIDETVDLARNSMARKTRLHHVAMNVAKLVNMRTDPELAADVKASDIVGIDGAGIVLAAKLLGLPRADRVAGIDLMHHVLAVCAAERFKPYLLGATPEVVQMAAAAIKDKHPTIEFAGVSHGYFKAEDEARLVSEIRLSNADCLFVAMPTPRKERFLAAHRDSLGVPFIMGVGGSFDVLAGHVSRAPLVMQTYGLEWLYRVYQEPRRMWWRYARSNTLFAGILLRSWLDHVRTAPDKANSTNGG